MINDVKDAVAKAVFYANSLLGSELTDFMLEEVELSDDGKYWLITVGFNRSEPQAGPLQALTGTTFRRVYKVVKIRKDNGQFVSMTMRQP